MDNGQPNQSEASSLLSEAEAQKKWCSFARATVTLDVQATGNPLAIGSGNRFPGDKYALCIASGCMSWRWGDQARGLNPANPQYRERTEPRRGFCGLAGEPTNR